LAELDVRSAYVEVMRARDQTAAATVTRQFDEQKLAAELEKFKINQASAFQVARAQRDLAKSQVAEAQAAVDYEKALVELYRLEGSLLERRGIASPGREPVDLAGGE
jgi:outer membrane protein TolC